MVALKIQISKTIGLWDDHGIKPRDTIIRADPETFTIHQERSCEEHCSSRQLTSRNTKLVSASIGSRITNVHLRNTVSLRTEIWNSGCLTIHFQNTSAKLQWEQFTRITKQRLASFGKKVLSVHSVTVAPFIMVMMREEIWSIHCHWCQKIISFNRPQERAPNTTAVAAAQQLYRLAKVWSGSKNKFTQLTVSQTSELLATSSAVHHRVKITALCLASHHHHLLNHSLPCFERSQHKDQHHNKTHLTIPYSIQEIHYIKWIEDVCRDHKKPYLLAANFRWLLPVVD